MKRRSKLLSKIPAVLMAVCVTFSAFAGLVFGEASIREFSPSESSFNTTVENTEIIAAEEPQKQYYYDNMLYDTEECGVLRYVNESEFKSKKHVLRIPEQEELNTYVFQNSDGTKTVYFLNENVKFISDDGEIVEKNISLVTKEHGYDIVKNDIDLTLPYNPNDGVRLNRLNRTITITPITARNSSDMRTSSMTEIAAGTSIMDNAGITAAVKDNSVIYSDIFGEGVSLKYTPLLSGVKEDIILSAYTPDASYSFILNTDSLYLREADGRYFLSESGNNQPMFYLGDVIIYDAVGKPGEGCMSVVTVSEGSEYILTLTADDNFLSDPETVWPVTIDPSITVSDNTHGENAIEDAPVFSGYPSRNFGTYLYNRVGTPDSNYGIGRTVIRLRGLISSSSYTGLNANQITDVKFYAREASGGTSHFINLYPMTGSTTWSESTITWNSTDSYTTSVNYGASMYDGQWTAFDITNLVKAWKNGTYSANACFIMMNQNEANNKCFYSSECSNSANRPYVVMTYTTTGEIDFNNAQTLSFNTYSYVPIPYGGTKKCFKFIPSYTGLYTFESSVNMGDPMVWLYNSERSLLASNDDSAGSGNFRLTYHLIEGYTYYLVTGCYGSGTGYYYVNANITASSNYISASTVDFNSSRNVSNISLGVGMYRFVPQKTGEYLFYSSGNSDSRIWIYSSSLSRVGENDDGAGNYNFRLNVSLTAGATYYIVAGHFGAKSGSYIMNMLTSANISAGIYHLRNVATSLYADIHGPVEQIYIHQWSYHTNSQEKWTFNKESDGYYTIRSEYGNRYYIGISDALSETKNVKLFSGTSSNTKWKIYANYKGELFFEPMNAAGKLLYSPDTDEGSELRLSYMGSYVMDRNKWNVLKKVLFYVNYYDSSFVGNSSLIGKIPTANSFADAAYANNFNIGIHMDGNSIRFPTITDNCPTGVNSPCTYVSCGSSCNYSHHKNVWLISNQLYNSRRENNHLYVLWANRSYGTYCYDTSGGHALKAIALVYGERPVIQFLTIDGDSDVQLACMAISLVHETAHTFKMDDVYDNAGHDSYSEHICVMEKFKPWEAYKFYKDVMKGDKKPFCSSCEKKIRELTSNVNIPGN